MQTEIIIYGLRPGETREYMEEILYSHAKSISHANKVMKILSEKHGCTKMRVWTFDGSAPDFTKTLS